jgi:hypothetical protein
MMRSAALQSAFADEFSLIDAPRQFHSFAAWRSQELSNQDSVRLVRCPTDYHAYSKSPMESARIAALTSVVIPGR